MAKYFLLFSSSSDKQEIMRQSSAKLDDLLAPFNDKLSTAPSATDEETAIAALTALRNNNHHLNFHHQQSSTNNSSRSSETSSPPVSKSSSVTSLISRIHLQNLEANSVSVIPLDTQKQQSQSSTSSTRTSPSLAPPQISVKNLSQLQQHLETAAVLMDMGKKVIISPPSSKPQSPNLNEQNNNSNSNNKNNHQSITSTVIKVSQALPIRSSERFLTGDSTESSLSCSSQPRISSISISFSDDFPFSSPPGSRLLD